jgi:hypothetical protein
LNLAKGESFQEDNLIWNQKAFPNKIAADEDIILVVREDILLIGFRMLTFGIIGFVLFMLKYFIGTVSKINLLNSFLDTFFYSVISLMIIAFAYRVHNYYLSLQIVTDKRLIDVDQRGLFNREVNELALEKIEDISYKPSGVWGTIFNYGYVSVQTAAEASTEISKSAAISSGFVFENVPNPAKVHAIISEVYHTSRSNQEQKVAKLNAEAMSQILQPNAPANKLYEQNELEKARESIPDYDS